MYHPYAVRIKGKTEVCAQNKVRIERDCEGKDTLRFAFVTDTQGSYDDLQDAVDVIKSDPGIDFIVHGGDMSDFGLTKEFVWCRDMLESQPRPYVTVLGNHDCLGNGEDTYAYIFGDYNYSFTASFVHFVMLNTNALEYDYSNPVPDLKFIRNDADSVMAVNKTVPDSITHTVVVMHSRPTDEQFNNNVAEAFNYTLHFFPGMKNECGVYPLDDADTIKAGTLTHAFCVNGHNHREEVLNIFKDGLLYWGCQNMAKRQFFVFTITKDGYDCKTVNF